MSFAPLTLAEREQSSMASCWNESLLLKQNEHGQFYLAVCGHEVLGNIYELPEDEIYDEDENLITPTHYKGQPVLDLEDGEWLVGAELVEKETSRPFDASSLAVAAEFLSEQGWDDHPEASRILDDVRTALSQGAQKSEGGTP